jgi:hypothetical protein
VGFPNPTRLDSSCFPSCLCTENSDHFLVAHLAPTMAAVEVAFPDLRSGKLLDGKSSYDLAMDLIVKVIESGVAVRQVNMSKSAKRDACDAWRKDVRRARILRNGLRRILRDEVAGELGDASDE